MRIARRTQLHHRIHGCLLRASPDGLGRGQNRMGCRPDAAASRWNGSPGKNRHVCPAEWREPGRRQFRQAPGEPCGRSRRSVGGRKTPHRAVRGRQHRPCHRRPRGRRQSPRPASGIDSTASRRRRRSPQRCRDRPHPRRSPRPPAAVCTTTRRSIELCPRIGIRRRRAPSSIANASMARLREPTIARSPAERTRSSGSACPLLAGSARQSTAAGRDIDAEEAAALRPEEGPRLHARRSCCRSARRAAAVAFSAPVATSMTCSLPFAARAPAPTAATTVGEQRIWSADRVLPDHAAVGRRQARERSILRADEHAAGPAASVRIVGPAGNLARGGMLPADGSPCHGPAPHHALGITDHDQRQIGRGRNRRRRWKADISRECPAGRSVQANASAWKPPSRSPM